MSHKDSKRRFLTYFSPQDHAADHIIGFIDRVTLANLPGPLRGGIPGYPSLDIAVYSITHDGIADALIRAHEREVVIRVLTDKVQASGRYADDERLEAAGIPVRRDTQRGLMHHKFCIENGRVLGVGSANWSKNADEYNAENWNVVRLVYAAEEYLEEFNRLWELNAP
jgi:phosphatidylserine/phosphatidylglycerophosphate/cardiolipin synthase-like enzyme